VAHYLASHGWQRDLPVARLLEDASDELTALHSGNLKPEISLASLQSHGVEIPAGIQPTDLATLIRLQVHDGYEYWIGLKNFYVITRYNHSALYAMAVYQLAMQIRDSYETLIKENND